MAQMFSTFAGAVAQLESAVIIVASKRAAAYLPIFLFVVIV
jgi:hypothetical protein